jgi:hypothetical protein
LFTGVTWHEFLKAGAAVSGFREGRRKTVQRIEPQDYLLCYLTGVSRFIGILEVTSEPYWDETPIWKDELFPCRVEVMVVASLTPDTAVPIFDLKEQLSIFQNLKTPAAWTGHVRGSPKRWSTSDGTVVTDAVLEATRDPISRPVDPAKLAYRPKAIRAKGKSYTVPDKDSQRDEEPVPKPVERHSQAEATSEATAHTEIQWLLLKLGSDMGLDVWAARNDRNREFRGHRFSDLSRLKTHLPLPFDEVTNRTVELIDVLWLRGTAIVAAFEIESTTSIYSGLLRMSDLITMQPNLNIPLYLVAPDERRDKVITEVNRPTFSRRNPPMNSICSFIPFSTLRRNLERMGDNTRYLRPDFVEGLSEPCVAEEP